MAVIDDCKTLLNIADTSKDNLIALYIRRAETSITKYLNTEIDQSTLEIDYADAICQFVVEAWNRRKVEGYKQYMAGSRQGMMETGLSEMVKALLPLPKVTLMG